MVLDPLAMEILEGRIHDGDTVRVDTDGHKMTFAPEVREAA
jgi:ATP-dependent Clp protease ATP-binding subunit ClpA